MALSPEGVLFVGTRGSKAYAVVDTNKDNKADNVITIANGLRSPNGVAFRNGSLYLAEISKVWRYDNIEKNLHNLPDPVLINDHFPGDSHHGWRFIAFSLV